MFKEIRDLVYDESLTGEDGLFDLWMPEGVEHVDNLLVYFHGGGLEAGKKCDQRKTYELLCEAGIAIVSPNYRMYPNAKFPEFLEDAAKAVAYSINHVKEYIDFDNVYVGGISAGSYISLMLHFDKSYLAKCGIDEAMIKGYIFDAGQPTTHYNVLRERGIDVKTIRVDEAAPVYFCDENYKVNNNQKYKFFIAGEDFPGRKEQNEMLIRTMVNFGVKETQIDYEVVPGYHHAGYTDSRNEEAYRFYAKRLIAFIK